MSLNSSLKRKMSSEIIEAVGGFKMALLGDNAKDGFSDKSSLFFANDKRAYIWIRLPECEYQLKPPYSLDGAILIGSGSRYRFSGIVENDKKYEAKTIHKNFTTIRRIKVIKLHYIEQLFNSVN